MRSMVVVPWIVWIVVAGCGLPRDAAGTLERVRGGLLRVGVVHNPPFVVDAGGAVRGVEAALAEAIAHELGSQIEWRRGAEHTLMRALHRRELDLVIGGFDEKVPWVREAALTRPYYTDEKPHVLALPPGENAWMVKVERILHANEPRIGELLTASVR
jgi:polar amino acid transport system substrate-binding protein